MAKDGGGSAVVVALVSVMLGSLAVNSEVYAQAGSTGGSIGKTNKSQSGADPAARADPDTRKPAKQGGTPTTAASSCSKMPGNWSWFNFNNVVIRPNSTASAGPFSATWSCKNDVVVMHWNHGYTDRLKLSRDGTHLEGTNGSVTVTGDRK